MAATATGTANAATRGLYVANYNASGTITQFGFNTATGAVTALSPATAAAANSPRIIAITPNGAFAYVTNTGTGTVRGYAVGSGGALTPTAQGSIAAGSTPVGAVVSPDGKRLYSAACGSNLVYAFDIDQSTGALTANAVPTVAGQCPHKMVFSPDGKYLYASNWNGSALLTFDVNVATGSLTAHSPASVGGVTNPVGVSMTPDGTSLYVANDGASTISQFTVNTTTGSITAKTPGTVATNGPARSVVVSPDGKRLYLATHGADSVMVFNIASGTGLLSAASPASVSAGTTPRFVTMSPDGKRLFVSNNGSNAVSLFDVNATTGALTASSTPSVAAGTGEWGMAIVPNQGPSASFSKTINGYGTASTFNASGSTDPDGSVARYDWDWGDGTTTANGGATPSHTFAGPGTYTVRLTVTDDEGCSTAYVATTAVATCNGSSGATTSQTAKVAGSGRYVYIGGTAGGAASYTYQPSTTATVAGYPGTTAIPATTRQVALSPDGKNAYVASTAGGGTVYQFSIDATTGELVAKSPATVAAGAGAHSSVVSPDGRRLYVTNQTAGTVSQFDIDATTGALTAKSPATVASGSGPEIPSVAPNGKFLYVPNFAGNSVSVYTINQSTGALSAPATMSTGASSGPTSVVLSKDSRFAYVVLASLATIATYSVDQVTGQLTAATPATIATGTSPHQAAINPAGTRLYVRSSSPNGLFIFDIDASTGALTAHSPTYYATGANSLGIAMSPDGRSLFFQNGVLRPTIVGANGDLTAGSPTSIATVGGPWSVSATPDQAPTASFTQSIAPMGSASTFNASASSDSDGTVARYDWDWGDGTTSADAGATPSHTYTNPGNFTVTLTVTDNEGCSVVNGYGQGLYCNPTGVNPATRSAVVAGSGRYVYAGNITAGTVSGYTADRASGAVAAIGPSAASAGGARRIAFSADGRFAYAPSTTFHAIYQFSVDQTTGALTALSPASLSTGSNTSPIASVVTRDGNHLLVVQNSGLSNTVRTFDINTSTGLLSNPGVAAVAAGSRPVDIALTPDGKYAYVANNSGSSVSQYAVNATTGQMTPLPTASIAAGTGPSGIRLTPDGRFAYVSNVSSGFISTYSIGGDGQLTALATVTAPTGSNDVVISPDGLNLYSFSTSGSTVTPFSLNPSTGALTPLASGAISAPNARGAAISADGARVYAGDSTNNALLLFNRSSTTGVLTPASPASAAAGTGTWGVATTVDQGPSPSFTMSVASSGGSSTFDGSASTDSDGTVARYDWDFGDGTTLSTVVPTASHTFASGGSYTVKLTVTDSEGCAATLVTTGGPTHCNPSGSPIATRTASVTTTAPTISSAPSGLTGPSATVSFTGPGSGATFECQLDTAAWTACASPATFSGLSDGTHAVGVRTVDLAGGRSAAVVSSTWTVDATPPTTPSISSGPAGGSYATTAAASFAFSSTDSGGSGVASYSCRLDGASWATCTSAKAYSALSEGSHTFDVRATDAVGNTSAVASRTWTVDTVTPSVSITAGPPSPSGSASPSFTFSSTDGTATFECKLDGGAWSACTSPRSLTSLGDGSHTFSVRATDPAGNVSAANSRIWTVDTAAPAATITSAPPSVVTSATASISFTSDDPSATFTCALDGGALAACTSPTSFTSLADGSHTAVVRATDLAGNISPAASTTWTIDTTGPATAITSGPAALTNLQSASFAFTADDPAASFACRLDAGTWTACTSPKTLSGLSDGGHTFSVRGTDVYGNVGTADAVTWTVDATPPVARIDAAPSALVGVPDANLLFSTADPAASLACQLDGSAWSTCTSPSALTGLADGSHTFRVRATDPAGNTGPPDSATWTVDTTAPGTSITSAPASLVGTSSASIGFSSADPSAVFSCRLDGGPWSGCATPYTASGLADGSHTFQVRATDPVGNVGASDSATWIVDTSAPDATITSRPGTLSASDQATFAFSSSASGATFECRLDAGSWASCSSPKSLSGLADGGHTFSVRATSQAGNTSTPATVSWTVDTAAPATTITSAPASPSASTSATVAFTSSDGAATFQCRLDGGSWTTCTSPASFTGLSEASHTVAVRATDLAGNTGPQDAASWIVDTTAPTATIVGGPAALTATQAASFGLTSNDPSASFECALDSGAWAPCTDPATLSAIVDGAHVFRARATDDAGNTGTADIHSWVVDTVAPHTTILTGPAGASNSGSGAITFAADEPGVTFECRIDSGAWSGCASPATFTGLLDGNHVFTVRGTDPTGNTGPSDTLSWSIDSAAPGAVITSAPIGTVATDSAVTAFDANDPGATFECQLDAGTWTLCSSPRTLSGLSDASHTFRVRATDGVGNTSPAAEATWTVDTAAPSTTIATGPAALVATSSATFTFTSSDPSASLSCRLDGGSWATCTSPVTVAGLADGQHDFRVRATDPVGNVGPSDVATWTIDTTAPRATITAGPSVLTTSTSAAFSFTTDEPSASTECRLDAGSWQACTSPVTRSALSDGAHTFAVRGVDVAGNVGTPDAQAWTVDTTPPSATIDAGPPALTNVTSASFAFSSTDSGASFECQVDAGTWAACVSPRSYNDRPDGAHVFRVRATDAAGNTGPVASRAWTIDTSAPSAALTGGPPALTGSTSASFGFTSPDAGATFQCQLDAAPWASCAAPKTLSAVTEGSHTFSVRAVDPAGNVGVAASASWQVDLTAPTTVITSRPAAASGATAATFAFVSPDASQFECQLDAGTWNACASPKTLSGLSDGSHDFSVRATDDAGNLGDAVLVHWTIDTGAPTATIDAAPTGYVRTRAAAFTFSSTDQGATFECRLDAGAWSACNSPTLVAGLVDGPHQFSVRPTDLVGNVGAVATVSWQVDATAPTAAITTAVPRNQVTERQSIAFESDDPSASFECRLDDGAWQTCSSPRSVVAGTEGQHTFAVRALDLHGNVGAADARTWSLTLAAPETTIDEAPSGYTSDASPRFRFSSGDTSATFECRIDDERWSACTSPLQRSLPDGIHAFSVRALSPAGTVDPDPAARSFAIDTVAPDTAARNVPTGATADNALLAEFSSNEFAVRYRCSLDGRAATDCGAELHATDLNPGDHRLVVAAVDRAGNSDSTPVDQRWTVDQYTATPAVLSASSDILRRRLRCATQPVPGAVVTGYQWLRNGAPIPGADGATYLPAPRDDRGRLGCSIGLRFVSGATRRLTAEPLIILGRARLNGLSLSPSTFAASGHLRGRDMTVRFSLNRPSTVLVRLWCRPTPTATCPGESPRRKDYRRAVRSSYRLVGFAPVNRMLVNGHRGINRVSLRNLLPHDLPAADYRLTVRLHERIHAGAPKLSASLQRRFTGPK